MVSGGNISSSSERQGIKMFSIVDVMGSQKSLPSTIEIGNIMGSQKSLTSTIEIEDIMGSEKSIPSTFEIEDIMVDSAVELTALPMAIPPSTTNKEDNSPGHDSPPDGGLFAWLQVLGGWLLVLNSRGMTNTFGAFQTYYTSNLLHGTSSSNISWIGSIQSFTLMFVGVLSGRLLDTGYLRTQLCAGIFLEVLGLLATSISTKYWHVLFSQGICVGIGAGLLYLPSVAVPAQYFSSKIMLATGFVATGSSMAGVVYPILIRELIPKIKFPWTLRCLALIVLVTNCTGMALIRPRLKPRGVKPLTINVSVFLDSPYVLFVLAMTCIFASVYIPYFYLGDFVQSSITDPRLATYVLSIMNAASFLGRILPNWLADWNQANKLIVVSVTCLLSGVTLSSWLAVRGRAGTIAFTIAYGFISGGLVSLPPVTVASLSKNQDQYGTRMGMAFTISSFGALVGNPIAGALLAVRSPSKQKFLGPWLFAGGTMISAAALTMGAYYIHNRDEECSDNSSGNSSRDSGRDSGRELCRERRRKSQWLQSLANEALTMQGAAFAL